MRQVGLFLMLVLVVGLVSRSTHAASPKLSGTDKRQHARQLAQFLARRSGLPADGWACRYAGATLADRVSIRDGKPQLKDKYCERPLLIFPDYKAIGAALDRTSTPPEYKELMKRHYARLLLWPIWQGPPDVGVEAFGRRMDELKGPYDLIRLKPDALLFKELKRRRPVFARATPLQQKLIYDALAEINPFMRPLHRHVQDLHGGVYKTAPAWRADGGPNLLKEQSFQYLWKVDPELRIVSSRTQRALEAQKQGECLRVPIAPKQYLICAYRVPPLLPLLLPGDEWFARQANPRELDLKNLWLKDLQSLRGMQPTSLDLAGCCVEDLSPLAGMTSLRRLRLDRNPVHDLTPLRNLRLTHLDLRGTRVNDISPLKGMKLKRLVLAETDVEDLSPLISMPLEHLNIDHTPVQDLAPLALLPLKYLKLNIAGKFKDFRVLGNIKTLKCIGDVPMHAWFSEYEQFHRGVVEDAAADADCEAPRKVKRPKTPPKPKEKSRGPALPSLGDELDPVDLGL